MITKSQIIQILQASGSSQDALFREARRLRHHAWGDTVILRGVIEITNICRIDCEYCPMRRSNQSSIRPFLANPEHIIAAAKEIKNHGIDVVFIQGGEMPKTTGIVQAALPHVKSIFNGNVEILLGLGNKTQNEYKKLWNAGARSYILKHETSDPLLHQRLRHESLNKRLQHISSLLAIGYRLGTGSIVGLPGQSVESLANDIILASDLGVHMASVSPFIPADATPLSNTQPANIDLTLNAIAAMRLINPHWLIPSVSALNKLQPDGQLLGIMAGANVLTANFTPASMQDSYLIYGKSRYVARLHALEDLLRQAQLRPRGSCWLASHSALVSSQLN